MLLSLPREDEPMGRALHADFSEVLLFPPAVEDWVVADHPARFIRAFVEAQDLEALGVNWNPPQPLGCPTYSAELLLMVWLYGYFVNLRSTRKLEAGCREQMGLVWLAGRHTPDHNTLWRFFDRNKAMLRNLFKQSVQVAMRADMVGMVVHALDGTKVRALASTRGRLERKELEALQAELDAVISNWEQEVADTAAPDAPGTGLPKDVQDSVRLRDRISAALAELDQPGAPDKVHPSDPEARVMKCSDVNAKRLGYNSQAVVDTAHGIIVCQEVVQKAFDDHQLTPMLDHVEASLGALADTTLADAGYATGAALAHAEALERNVLVNLPPRLKGTSSKPYHASNFDYDIETDTVTCPLGTALEYTHTRQHNGKGKGYAVRVYRCHNKQCPVRDQCTKDRKGRGIERGPHHDAITRQKKRQREDDERALLKQRGGIVESAFGLIKQRDGFRCYTRHGLEKAKTEWAMICTAYNLKKLYRAWKAAIHQDGCPHQPQPA